MHTGTIYLLILLSILDLILLNADTYDSINTIKAQSNKNYTQSQHCKITRTQHVTGTTGHSAHETCTGNKQGQTTETGIYLLLNQKTSKYEPNTNTGIHFRTRTTGNQLEYVI